MSKLSVIITVRGNEPFLKKTIENVRSQAGCKTEIIVVFDGEMPDDTLPVEQILGHKTSRGIGPSRHKGIKAASGPVVMLTDAHMTFSQGFGKLILKHFAGKDHARDVACGVCMPTFPDLTMDKSQRHTACRFCLRSQETGGEIWVMSGKWSPQDPGGPVGCVYGAAYCFTKAWYRKIGEPLALLRGWWGDEEYLSAASWLAGGRCFLLPFEAGHLFRDKPNYQTSGADPVNRLVNRARLVDLLPAPADVKEQMQTYMGANILTMAGDYQRTKADDANRPEVQAAMALWGSWAGNWKALLPWIDLKPAALAIRLAENRRRRPIPVLLPQPTAPTLRVQTQSRIVCPRCGAEDAPLTTETRADGNFRRIRCRKCGLRGTKSSLSGQPHVVRWGSDA